MKLKYCRLDKKEKRIVRDEFFATDAGRKVKKRSTNVFLCGILCLFFGTYLIYDAFASHLSIFEKIYAIVVGLFGLFFILFGKRTLVKIINNYLVKKK